MDRWILDGYLCRNAGDDMMIAELCVANPEMRFEAPDLAGGEGPSLTRIPNLSTGRRSPWLLRACLVEGYVMCGGSMFIDHRQGLRARAQFLRRWMRRILVAMVLRVRRKSVQVVGCNLGPVETPWGRFIFPVFLWLATRVSVRDSASVALLQSWGVDNVEKAPDMVLSYLARPEVTRRLPESGLASAVGVSVMEWPGVPRATVLDRYASMVEAILSRDPSVTVKLLGFQDRFVRDDLLCEELMVRLGKDGARRVQNCSYRGDIDVLLRDFASCSRVLAVRFHSGILALGLGLPMVQIVYSNKIEEFLQDAGWQGLLVPLQGLATIEDAPLIDALFAAPGAEYLPPEARAHAAGLRP